MLTVTLTELDRSGPIRVRGEIPAEDPTWSDWDEELASPVSVDLLVSATPTGQVLARGDVEVSIARTCRRCLDPVEVRLAEELTLLWVPSDRRGGRNAEDAGEEEGFRLLEPMGNELDLGPALREELVLATPTYVTCGEDCRGLCPVCGTNLNEETCDCDPVEPDPRWDALRDLTEN